MCNTHTGKLYLVSTPIGNLEDITLRALRILREVDLIACEDTRHSRKLLSHYKISNPLTSYHSYNKSKKTPHLLRLLKEGKRIALITDSGTPGISDPSFYLVKSCIEENIPLTAIPGPTSLISALVVSGLPTDKFVFLGFLPSKKGKKKKAIESIKENSKTVVFFESPHRIEETLKEMEEILGDRPIALARELTKRFEEVIRGKTPEVRKKIIKEKMKGEIVVIVGAHSSHSHNPL